MTEENKTPTTPIAIARLGNVQALVEWRGEGPYRRMTLRITKIVDPKSLEMDPTQTSFFEMEEVAALCLLLKDSLKLAMGEQGRMIRPVAPTPTEE